MSTSPNRLMAALLFAGTSYGPWLVADEARVLQEALVRAGAIVNVDGDYELASDPLQPERMIRRFTNFDDQARSALQAGEQVFLRKIPPSEFIYLYASQLTIEDDRLGDFEVEHLLTQGASVVVGQNLDYFTVLPLARAFQQKLSIRCRDWHDLDCQMFSREGARVLVGSDYDHFDILRIIYNAKRGSEVQVDCQGIDHESCRRYAIYGASLLGAGSPEDIRILLNSMHQGSRMAFYLSPPWPDKNQLADLIPFDVEFIF